MANWRDIAPKRLKKFLDAARLLTRTGHKDYEPIDSAEADIMMGMVRDAIQSLEEAYASYLPESPPAPATPQPAAPKLPTNPYDVASFVHQIPYELLSSYAVHIACRVTDEFHIQQGKP